MYAVVSLFNDAERPMELSPDTIVMSVIQTIVYRPVAMTFHKISFSATTMKALQEDLDETCVVNDVATGKSGSKALIVPVYKFLEKGHPTLHREHLKG